MTTDLGLIDQSIIEAARVKQAAAWKRVTAARDDQRKAEAALADAAKHRDALVTRAAEGATVSPSDLRRAEEAARDAETGVAFAHDVERRLVRAAQDADREFNACHAKAAEPLAREGARRLLDAAKRREEALDVVKAIEVEMDEAAEAISAASRAGFPLKHGVPAMKPGWGIPQPPPATYTTAAEVQHALASAGFRVDELATWSCPAQTVPIASPPQSNTSLIGS